MQSIDCLFFGVVADVTVVVSQSTYSLYRVVNRGPFTATHCRNLPWKWRTFWTTVPISCHSTVFPRKLLIACCCCCFCVVLAHFLWCLRDFGSSLGNAMVALIAFLESRVRLVKFGPFCWLSAISSLIHFFFVKAPGNRRHFRSFIIFWSGMFIGSFKAFDIHCWKVFWHFYPRTLDWFADLTIKVINVSYLLAVSRVEQRLQVFLSGLEFLEIVAWQFQPVRGMAKPLVLTGIRFRALSSGWKYFVSRLDWF